MYLSVLICFVCLFTLSTAKSLEPRNNRLKDLPSILRDSNSDDRQQNTIRYLDSNQKNDQVSAGSSDEIINIIRGSLAKLPGESMGRLIDKRNAYLNLSTIEELLDLETNLIDVGKDEPGCYIEIKIVKRIPGRCAMIDGEPVCRADNYYKQNNECTSSL